MVFFVPAIETALENIDAIKKILEEVSGRKLDESWSPVQVLEEGYLKNRKFLNLNKDSKTIIYEDQHGEKQEIDYSKGLVKLNWRIDWPARWALLGVHAEPFGRDHATKGGSYDTGAVIVKDVFEKRRSVSYPISFYKQNG